MTRATTFSAFVSGIALAVGLWGAAAHASDSVELLDGSDFKIIETPLEQRPLEPWPTLEPEAVDLLPDAAPANAGQIYFTAPARTETGISIGMEISLDDSDQIELKDADRIFIESGFGRADNVLFDAATIGRGLFSSNLMTKRGLDSVSLLSRAASLSLDARTAVLLSREPGALSPSYAGISLGFSNADRFALDPSERGFNIAITSMVMSNQPKAGEFTYIDAAAYSGFDQAYNVGLNVGYRGFTFAASFLRGQQTYSTYESYDVGLSYDFGSWATTVSVGGYFANHDAQRLLSALDVDRLYSVEIGASYRIRPWFTVSGSLRLFDYSTLLGTELDGIGGSLFLGTGLSF